MIVVTGAAGFIGSALVWALNQRGTTDILAVDALDSTESWRNLVNLNFSDYLDRADFLTQIDQGKFDQSVTGILHMGACSSTTERDLDFLIRNNYQYTQRLATWSLQHHKRFVYASSAATYGAGRSGFSDDHATLDQLKPLNGYGFSKYLFDRWALNHHALDHIAGLKFFNVFGPNEYHKGDMRSMVHKAFGQITQHGRVKLFKSHRPDFQHGHQRRDFVYVKDVVAATLAIYDHPAAHGIFNIGTGQARSFYHLAAATFAALDRTPDIEFIDMPESIRAAYQYYTQAEVTKLHQVWPGSTRSLEEAVTDYVRNHLTTDDPYLA